MLSRSKKQDEKKTQELERVSCLTFIKNADLFALKRAHETVHEDEDIEELKDATLEHMRGIMSEHAMDESNDVCMFAQVLETVAAGQSVHGMTDEDSIPSPDAVKDSKEAKTAEPKLKRTKRDKLLAESVRSEVQADMRKVHDSISGISGILTALAAEVKALKESRTGPGEENKSKGSLPLVTPDASKTKTGRKKALLAHLKNQDDVDLTPKQPEAMQRMMEAHSHDSPDSSSEESDTTQHSLKQRVVGLFSESKGGQSRRRRKRIERDVMESMSKKSFDQAFDSPTTLHKKMERLLRKADSDEERTCARALRRLLFGITISFGIGAAKWHNNQHVALLEESRGRATERLLATPKDPILWIDLRAKHVDRGCASSLIRTNRRGNVGGGGGNGGGGKHKTGGPSGGKGGGDVRDCSKCGRRHNGKCVKDMNAAEKATFHKKHPNFPKEDGAAGGSNPWGFKGGAERCPHSDPTRMNEMLSALQKKMGWSDADLGAAAELPELPGVTMVPPDLKEGQDFPCSDPILALLDVARHERTLTFWPPVDDGRAHVRRHLKGWLRLVLWSSFFHPPMTRESLCCAQLLIGGIGVEFSSLPQDGHRCDNTKTVSDLLDRVRSSMEKHKAFRAVRGVPILPDDAIVQPIHAKDEGHKVRMLPDLSRNSNDCQVHCRPRCEGIMHAMRQARRGTWFSKEDLTKCFMCFPLHPAVRRCCIPKFDGDFWQFVTMCFGDSKAPRAVTPILDLLSRFARDHDDIQHSRPIDGFFGMADTEAAAATKSASLRGMIRHLGLIVAGDKSEGPAQRLVLIGVGFDSTSCVLFVEEKKRLEALKRLRRIVRRRRAHAREMAGLAGFLDSISLVLPQLRPLHRAFCQWSVDAGHTRKEHKLRFPIRHDAMLCISVLGKWNSTHGWCTNIDATIATDGSTANTGIGGGSLTTTPGIEKILTARGLERNCSGLLGNTFERFLASCSDIQWSEMLAILVFVLICCDALAGLTILVRCDNSASVAIIDKWSTKDRALRSILRVLSMVCLLGRINLVVRHIAGKDNVLADHWSRALEHTCCMHHPVHGKANLVLASDICIPEMTNNRAPLSACFREKASRWRRWTP